MTSRIVDDEISLIKYYPYYATTMKWYQDYDLVKKVDNKEELYDLSLLKGMYSYLNRHGHLFYIKYKNRLCGDVCLKNDGEIAIAICKKYQNKHIGRRVINEIITLAKELNFCNLYVKIYSFNIQSQKMFESIGFEKIEDEKYVYLMTN